MKKIIEVLILVSSLMMIISCENMAKDPTAEYIVNTETTEEPSENPTETPTEENVPSWIANKIDGSDFVKKSNKVYELNGCYQMNYVRCGNINYYIDNINIYDNNNLTHNYTLNNAKNHNILSFDNNKNHKITLDFSKESISFTNNSQVYLEKVSDTKVNIIVVL